MKLFAVFGVVIVVAAHQILAQPAPSGSFSNDVANRTDVMLSQQENPNNLTILVTKISGLMQASKMHNIDFAIYGSIYRTLNKLAYLGSAMLNSEQVMNMIGRAQNNFDEQFDELSIQRDVDASLLPSKINELIDDFVSGHVETIVELFNNMYNQSNILLEKSEQLAANSIVLLDSFVEQVEKCLNVPRNKFRETFQCRQDARTTFPGLAHDTALIEGIKLDLENLEGLILDDKTSVWELQWKIRSEKNDLLRQINDERYNREQESEN